MINRTLKYTLVSLFIFSLQAATPLLAQEQSSDFVLGKVEKIESKILNETRILNIYTPPSYNSKDSIKYPVVYLLDGSADEDFIHIVGLYQFNTFSWIQQVPESIIVGIANVDRKRDFTFPSALKEERKNYPLTGHSKEFIEYLEKEVQPFVEKKYKGNGQRTLIGQSLGGLLGCEILLSKPDMFSHYVIISPSLWWSDGALLKEFNADNLRKTTQSKSVYIGVGKEGLAPSTSPHVMEVDANLFVEKLQNAMLTNCHVYFDYLPEENHATIGHQAVFNALKLLYPKPE